MLVEQEIGATVLDLSKPESIFEDSDSSIFLFASIVISTRNGEIGKRP